jgi:hypothetical protein
MGLRPLAGPVEDQRLRGVKGSKVSLAGGDGRNVDREDPRRVREILSGAVQERLGLRAQIATPSWRRLCMKSVRSPSFSGAKGMSERNSPVSSERS